MYTNAEVPAPVDLVARARGLRPLLRANAAQGDADRRVPDETIAALDDAGLFKILVPKRFGGHQETLRQMLDASAAVAEADGAAGWIVAIVNGCNWLTALYPEKAQEEVFSDPCPHVTGGLTPSGTASRADGGWRVSGQWYFNSGSWWSTWAAVTVPLSADDGTVTDMAMALIPREDMTIEDVWHVAGMRGTASNRIVVDDAFVPDHRVLSVPGAIEGNYPTPFTDETLYRSAFAPLLILALAGPLIGMGRAALALVTEKAATKPVANTIFTTQAGSTAFQLQLAEAATKIDAAELFCHRAAADIDGAAERGERMEYLNRARVRADTAYAVRNVTEALTTLMNAHGAGGFADTNPLQQVWRDASVAARHAIFSPAVAAEAYGKALLGVAERIVGFI